MHRVLGVRSLAGLGDSEASAGSHGLRVERATWRAGKLGARAANAAATLVPALSVIAATVLADITTTTPPRTPRPPTH